LFKFKFNLNFFGKLKGLKDNVKNRVKKIKRKIKYESKEGLIEFLKFTWLKAKEIILLFLAVNSLSILAFVVLQKLFNSFYLTIYILIFYVLVILLIIIFLSSANFFHFYAYKSLLDLYPISFFRRQAQISFYLSLILYILSTIYLLFSLTFYNNIIDFLRSAADRLFLIAILDLISINALMFLAVEYLSKLTLEKELRNAFFYFILIELTLIIDIYLSLRGFLEDNIIYLISSLISSSMLIFALQKGSEIYLSSLNKIKD